jgi:hypothetical protein
MSSRSSRFAATSPRPSPARGRGLSCPAEVVTHAVVGSVRAGHLPTVLVASDRMAIPPKRETKQRPKGPVLKPRFVLNLDDAAAERLRRYAYKTKRTKNEIVRDALLDHLEQAGA